MEINNQEIQKDFITSPHIMEHYSFLQGLGVFSYIDSLTRNIHNYKTLLINGLDIMNRTGTDEIMSATVEQISYNFLPSYVAFIWRPLQNHPDITMRAYRNYKPSDLSLKIHDIDLFDTFFKKSPMPICFEDLLGNLNHDSALEPFKAVEPEIIIPIQGPFGLYGIILLGRKSVNGKYTPEEMEFLLQLMGFVSQAIKSFLHYEHSLRDLKTGLYHHGFFMDRLRQEASQVRRHAYVSSVLVIDVDRFKNFNDTYGHMAGDMVLENLAKAIRKSVRNSDIPSRFGGEEFTIMLPQTDGAGALVVAERLRTSVSEMQVPWESALPQITISVGLCAFDANTALETEDILRRADEALYFSKAMGRNRSTIWDPALFDNTPTAALRSY